MPPGYKRGCGFENRPATSNSEIHDTAGMRVKTIVPEANEWVQTVTAIHGRDATAKEWKGHQLGPEAYLELPIGTLCLVVNSISTGLPAGNGKCCRRLNTSDGNNLGLPAPARIRIFRKSSSTGSMLTSPIPWSLWRAAPSTTLTPRCLLNYTIQQHAHEHRSQRFGRKMEVAALIIPCYAAREWLQRPWPNSIIGSIIHLEVTPCSRSRWLEKPRSTSALRF